MAVSPDGKTLMAMLQSPLDKGNAATKDSTIMTAIELDMTAPLDAKVIASFAFFLKQGVALNLQAVLQWQRQAGYEPVSGKQRHNLGKGEHRGRVGT